MNTHGMTKLNFVHLFCTHALAPNIPCTMHYATLVEPHLFHRRICSKYAFTYNIAILKKREHGVIVMNKIWTC